MVTWLAIRVRVTRHSVRDMTHVWPDTPSVDPEVTLSPISDLR